ncbi:hypothetical protein RJ639_025733 [Escallonia herrerae]|uniref:RNase H type-1 domain-containing protein n=1 Tax=Escallonia herrerae TaxID=1293975 RepID=A0AA89ACJ1_9ASTE|nr:hypothetical protein RJ639_025733 [Escallonia herrerae]
MRLTGSQLIVGKQWRALIIGLQMTLKLGTPSITISGDSKLVINQLLKYEVKKEDLIPYFSYATNLINLISQSVTIVIATSIKQSLPPLQIASSPCNIS